MSEEQQESLKRSLRSRLEQTLDERVDRYLSVNHQRFTGLHHFSYASAESLDLYRDGYFLSCVMVTQAVNEGIAKFVAERNGITPLQNESKLDMIRRMEQQGIVTAAFTAAFEGIGRSFRNDFHHMNPKVGKLDYQALAKRNITDLAVIEREIFECDVVNGGELVPKQPKYWDIGKDGIVPVWVRMV